MCRITGRRRAGEGCLSILPRRLGIHSTCHFTLSSLGRCPRSGGLLSPEYSASQPEHGLCRAGRSPGEAHRETHWPRGSTGHRCASHALHLHPAPVPSVLAHHLLCAEAPPSLGASLPSKGDVLPHTRDARTFRNDADFKHAVGSGESKEHTCCLFHPCHPSAWHSWEQSRTQAMCVE